MLDEVRPGNFHRSIPRVDLRRRVRAAPAGYARAVARARWRHSAGRTDEVFAAKETSLSPEMRIQSVTAPRARATAPRARALCLALCLAATAPQAQAFRLGALITRARAPKPLQKPDARKAWLDAAVVGPLPALANPPWLDAALRLAKRDAEAFVPELHATLTDTVSASPGATLKDVSAAVSQRAAAWAETRAPFARWTAAHYGVPIDAPQLGEALEPLYEEYSTAWKSNFRRPTPSTRRCT